MDDGDDRDMSAAWDEEEEEGLNEEDEVEEVNGAERRDKAAAVEKDGVKEVDDVAAGGAEARFDADTASGLKRCSARHSAAASAEAKSGADTCERAAATAATAEGAAGEAVLARKGSVNRGGENVCAGS